MKLGLRVGLALVAACVPATLVFAAEESTRTIETEVAEQRIAAFVRTALLDYYDVLMVKVVQAEPRAVPARRMLISSVTAEFAAVRNDKVFNPGFTAETCAAAGPAYLFCRPQGHEFAGVVEADIALTVEGWQILARNYDRLSPFPLSGYLVLGTHDASGYVLPPGAGR